MLVTYKDITNIAGRVGC